MKELTDYDWPGNIRQLQHVIERAILVSNDGKIDHVQLPVQITPKPDMTNQYSSGDQNANEKAQLLDALRSSNFKVSGPQGAAAKLNLTPAVVYGLIKKYGISKSFEVD